MKSAKRDIHQNVYGQNRKTLFNEGDLRLSLKPSQAKDVAILELSRKQSHASSKFEPCWSGKIRFSGNAVIVESLVGKK